jgi:hypothetical protein
MTSINRINNVYKMNKIINDTKNMDLNKMASNTIDNYANSATNSMNNMTSNTIDNMNKMASNTIDNVANSTTNTIDNMNKVASNTIDNVANSTTNTIDNMNKVASNTIDNSSTMTLADKLKKASAINGASDRSNLGDITKFAHNIGQSVGEVSKVFVDTSAEVASIGINTSGNALEIEATATVNEANKLSQIAADLAKTKLPGIINNVKDVTKVVTEGIGEVNNVIENTTLEMKEASIKAQIATMMAARPDLTEEQARRELEETERLEKEEIERVERLELEKAKIEAKEAESKAKEAEAKAKEASLSGGSNKRQKNKSTLKNIQKGGKMAAKRTQKSINDFLKPSITSSSVLKMMRGGKKSAKRRRYNYGARSKRRR